LDDFDRHILQLLQKDASLSVAVIAEKVGLSSTPCWRRIQKLDASGVIRARVALLDAEQLDLGLTVFVHLRIARHGSAWLADFTGAMMAMPEVLEVNRLAGNWDYLLRVLVADMPAYDRFYKRLIQVEGLNDVSSSFSMEQIKYTTALPL
jgi:Lrp/AsnC family transcriptional regulator